MRLASIALSFVVLAAAGCGGRPDPEFSGPIVEAPRSSSAGRSWSTAATATAGRGFARPKLVEIRADWCGFCRAAQPGIDTAYDAYASRVDRVVLDVTDEASSEAAAAIAEREGVGDFFATYRGRTPTVGVFVGPGDGRLVRGALEDPETLSRELAFAVDHFRTARGASTAPPGEP